MIYLRLRGLLTLGWKCKTIKLTGGGGGGGGEFTLILEDAYLFYPHFLKYCIKLVLSVCSWFLLIMLTS